MVRDADAPQRGGGGCTQGGGLRRTSEEEGTMAEGEGKGGGVRGVPPPLMPWARDAQLSS